MRALAASRTAHCCLSTTGSRPSRRYRALNAPIGRADALRRRIAKCEAERGIPGAIVAGDFYEQSDLVKVAEQLNQEPAAAG